jgi:transcriptional regulator with XRE-family HTH domain
MTRAVGRRSHGNVSVNPAGEHAAGESDSPSDPDGTPPMVQAVGALVRRLRGDAGLSLANVAESAGLSPGLLSQIERGMGNPSLTTLIKLAHALDVPVGRFFVSEQPAHAVVRSGEHPRLQIAEDNLVYELLTPHTHGRLGMIRAQVASGWTNEDAPFVHDGEECIFIVDGELTVSLAGSRYRLYDGDSITFDSALPHWYRNDTDRTTVTISAMTPPSF